MWRNKRLVALIAVVSVILVDVVAISHPVKSDSTARGIISKMFNHKTDLLVPNETTGLTVEADTTEKMKLELNSCKKKTTILEKTFHRVNNSCLSEFQKNLNKFDFTTDFEPGTFNTRLSEGVHETSQLNDCKYNNVLLKESNKDLKEKCLLFRQKNPEPAVHEYYNQRFGNDSDFKPRDHFLLACYLGDIYKVKLLHYGGVDVDVKTRTGLQHSCLSIAALRGNVNLTNVLINLGCDIDSRSTFGHTALFYSVYSVSNVELTKLLLDNGADVNAVSYDNLTPLDFADPVMPEVANLLKKYGAKHYRSLN